MTNDNVSTIQGVIGSEDERSKPLLSFSDPVTRDLMFAIYYDGRVERGPAFTTVDEMSIKFFDMLSRQWPMWKAEALREIRMELLDARRAIEQFGGNISKALYENVALNKKVRDLTTEINRLKNARPKRI